MEFNPGPKAIESFCNMFGDNAEQSPVGGYAGCSHFGVFREPGDAIALDAVICNQIITDKHGGVRLKAISLNAVFSKRLVQMMERA
jgi:hypothetical protein